MQVVPARTMLTNAGSVMDVVLSPYSFTSLDLALATMSLISSI